MHRPLPARGARACAQGAAADPAIFNAEDGGHAGELLGEAIERLERPLPKVAAMLGRAEEDLLAFYAFPVDHSRKLWNTTPLERLTHEIGRRTEVVARGQHRIRGFVVSPTP